ncbi:Phospholipase D beta 1 [Nymphaea thermarum]|nr:Phospholipase D beta 1 [Nymphaea thermarum]
MDHYHSFNPNYRPYYPPPPGAYPGYPMPPAPPNAYSPYPPYGNPHPHVHSPPQQNVFHHSGPLFPYPNSNPQPPPSFHSNSLPTSLNFGYPNNAQQQGSLQYVSESYQYYHHSSPPHPPPERIHSHQANNSLSPNSSIPRPPSPSTSSSSQLYPIEDVLASCHLSDDRPTSGTLSISTSFSGFQHQDLGSARPGIYGYPNYSFPSASDASQHGVSRQIVPYSPSKASLKVLLLHGSLDIHIYEARNLPNMDMFSKTLSDLFGRRVSKLANKIDEHMPGSITSDPYVSVCVSNAVVARTYVVSNNENPVWNQHSRVPVAHHAAEVQFIVKDSDMIGSQLIGIVSIPAEQIYSGAIVEGSFPILGLNKKPCKSGATLRISIQYIPMEVQTLYNLGVGGPDHKGIPGTYFPLRKGGRVTLYQDAHVPDGSLPALRLEGDAYYHHGKCWRDIFEAVKQARRLIYITGWSVYHMVRLVRDADYYSDTLGEILKAKSQEGVRVLLLVWDDPTSRRILGFQTDGLMATHDEETKKFFKHSSVRVLLCPRSAGKRHSWAKQQETGAIYTHHQKSVILDADAGNGKRKIIAFVGGLDLCDGRYDTPTHSLFRTLQTTHREDYHNPTFTADVTSPREPWHDLHCRIDGPAAYDVLTNFEERWSKSSKPHGIEKLKRAEDDSLLNLPRIPDILKMAEAPCLDENDPEAWHVQIFRSIDSNSVKGFPKDPRQAMRSNLTCGKNVMIDMSIHTAYVEAIRAAQHFIYIENQYFIGSSFNWSAHNDLGANNLIPMEIALKIAKKIKANERFSAYIVIPMWPEGVPTGNATQRILYWQRQTMQMMYDTIYKALEEANLEKTYHPRDYLTFFCLGNREVEDGCRILSPTAAPANTPQALAQKNRRFMIYVHSKGMIVDDEYVILGSANINQRSMDGTRDSEIAMGAYQPHHTWARKFSNPRGQIYGYRMSLWAEHLGILEDSFRHPESLGCIRRVNHMAELNWKQFASDQVTEMRGHLMKYPVEVDSRGKVKALPGCETFPDCGGNILGSFMMVQENLTV